MVSLQACFDSRNFLRFWLQTLRVVSVNNNNKTWKAYSTRQVRRKFSFFNTVLTSQSWKFAILPLLYFICLFSLISWGPPLLSFSLDAHLSGGKCCKCYTLATLLKRPKRGRLGGILEMESFWKGGSDKMSGIRKWAYLRPTPTLEHA
jgi:hypothetical protein